MIHYRPKEVYSEITVDDNNVFHLPPLSIDRACYKAIHEQVEEIGCKWIGDKDFIYKETITIDVMKELLLDTQDVIKSIFREATVDDKGVLHLPNYQLDRKTYAEVKKQVEAIGGKWKGGKTQGFLFHEKIDADKVREMLIKGVDLAERKKKYQFFGTPSKVANYILNYLPNRYNKDKTGTIKIKDTDKILEPSAGQGSIINAIHRLNPNVVVDCFEMMEENKEILKTIPNVNILGSNFLESDISIKYDIIVANPPFANNQDIDHVARMLEHLKEGGTLISIMSPHWIMASDLKSRAFRYLINNTTSDAHYISEGAFKESGTSLKTTFVVINKESLLDYDFPKILEKVKKENYNERLIFEKEMDWEVQYQQFDVEDDIEQQNLEKGLEAMGDFLKGIGTVIKEKEKSDLDLLCQAV